MQPKAIIAQNMDSGIIRSGQILHEGDWKYYLLKFAHPENQWQCEMEMAWYRMAQEAGIQMMPSSLMEFEGRKHFLTERFDRVGGDKVHLQTLGAMNPDEIQKMMNSAILYSIYIKSNKY
jgi:serine/threonine-protein kinase HipA